MNSTQRLLAVHRGQPADRVPVSAYELVGWNGDSWENREPSYVSLMDAVRERTDCLYMTHVQVPNADAGRISRTRERWDEGGQHLTRTTIRAGGRSLVSVQSFSDDVHTVWTREHPLKDLEDLAAWMALSWAPGEADFAGLRTAWERLGEDRGLPLVSFADPICELAEAFEFSQFMVYAITETETIARAMDALHERRVEMLRRVLAGPVRNAVFRLVGAEYATPPYLPPELFRRFVTRYNAEYAAMIRAAGGFPRLHSHGRIGRVIDQIAGMGLDALDPCEPPPDGDISIAELKAKIGGRVTLTGGIELKHLEHADGEFIERLVRETMAAGKPGGRFIIMPTAAPINVPLAPRTRDNYLRYIDTALEAGVY
ncbi:MAG: hypothetical protein BIFFINMI_02106 [Phycisphaerae bacterium]|nr:hypothetical protein [Phycisphaerae bacterium]